ncbi:MAG TPA: glycoside hydrolase family 15 protein, partial [Candidatus Dormibacteraeota bacterium]
YALLADGERAVLVGPRGDVAWMCFPQWDGDALFASLIGGGGCYTVEPSERYVWGGHYEEGTLIWRSHWVTASAVVECREALALPSSRRRAVVLRRVVARSGRACVRVRLAVGWDYGRRCADDVHRDDRGRWHLRAGDIRARWLGAADATFDRDADGGGALGFDLVLDEGRQHDLVLVVDSGEREELPAAPDLWRTTESEWTRRVPALHGAAGRRDARHAVAVLAGLTSADGGMVAAATTSLPEHAREGRNYDYRYAWIRDQCYAGQALAATGPHPLMDGAVAFVRDRLLADGPTLRPAYTVDGSAIPEPRRLDLPGYPGGSDIIGNRVREQFQLDVFGEALLLLAAADRHGRLDATGWRAAEIAAGAIARRRDEPDAGIWEVEPRRWTHSRLICAAGLRRIAERPAAGSRASEWERLAEDLIAGAARGATHRSGRWQRADDDPRVDVALLFPPIRGAVAGDDPRTLQTLLAVERELAEDEYVYRFRHDERPLGEAEGAFLLCGFVVALAWRQQGDAVRAARWFERNRAACGPPGLYSEEFDVEQRQLRGNLPQAFVHALLLEAAVTLGVEPEG